jgi:hypothetical protein
MPPETLWRGPSLPAALRSAHAGNGTVPPPLPLTMRLERALAAQPPKTARRAAVKLKTIVKILVTKRR